MQATFVVIEPKLTPSEYTVELPATIGRGRESDLKFSHGLLSRKHCELVEDDGGILVRDLGSRNGTFIGGRRVESSPLAPGELLTVGGITLRAIYGDATDVMLAPEQADQAEAALAETIPMDDTITIQAKPLAESEEWPEEESAMELEAEELQADEIDWLDEPEAPATSTPESSTPKKPADDDDFDRFLEGLR
jgi:pSer/pThr/pTyr-binding forkhead associated (FHA) protein